MTETRLEAIETAIRCALDEGTTLSDKLRDLSPTVNELLKVAFREEKLPSTFDVNTVLVFPTEDDAWEAQQRTYREMDDILLSQPPVELDQEANEEDDEDHECYTCGASCVPCPMGDDVIWLCEDCYDSRGCANCSGCQYCIDSGGYNPADEI